jgi:hypothetical protein
MFGSLFPALAARIRVKVLRVLTFLLEGEVLCEVATLVVPAEQEQGRRVTQLQCPEVKHALKEEI